MLKFIAGGDIFKQNATVVINTVNCVGVMGAGLALAFKKKYPEMFADYKKACTQKQVAPGKPHLYQAPEHLIINFPTKVDWKNPSEYDYIEDGLIWLSHYLSDHPDAVVAMPPMGCGLGGLEWSEVKHMINDFLYDTKATVIVCEPKGAQTIPEEKPIKIIVASSPEGVSKQLFNEKLDFYLSKSDPTKVELVCLEDSTIEKETEKYANAHNIALKTFPIEWGPMFESLSYVQHQDLLQYSNNLIVFTDNDDENTNDLISWAKAHDRNIRVVSTKNK